MIFKSRFYLGETLFKEIFDTPGCV